MLLQNISGSMTASAVRWREMQVLLLYWKLQIILMIINRFLRLLEAKSIFAKRRKMEESNQSRVSKSAVSAKQAGRVKKGQTIYKIQILTSDKKLSSGSKLFKGYKNVDYFIEKGIYKYTYGETTSFDSIRKLRRQVAKDFKDAL